MKYNPQIEIEITRLEQDGREVVDPNDEFIKLSSTINGELVNDYNHHSTNKPLDIEVSINKTLGNTQQTANVTIHNHPFIELIRENPRLVTASLQDNFYRLRIFAWHDDNAQVAKTARPNIPPCYVGDVLDGFSITANSTVDSSISIQAKSHSWLASSGKMKNTWAAGTDYHKIVDDIFEWFLKERNYGFETFGAVQKKAIEVLTAPALQAKVLRRSLNINRNPMETLNDICRDFDAIWGFNNNIPYFMQRKRFFAPNELNNIPINNFQPVLSDETGKIGINQYGLFSFNASSTFDSAHILGNLFVTFDKEQINGKGAAGRIDSINTTLSNGVDGHISNIDFSWLNEVGTVRLPRRSDDNSGRSLR